MRKVGHSQVFSSNSLSSDCHLSSHKTV
uniref:Uncharacterized protein n=1 Tax=Anguilla anguilla TaxID=7936 RepID=A0A0E9R363_ANGAN